jgi:hypothetical protein
MSSAEMMERIARTTPRFKARFVVSYYLLTILTGAFLLFFHGRLAFAADLIASVCYLTVTALFYDLSKPVNRSLFLLAAFFNLMARALGKLSFHPSGRISNPGAPPRERTPHGWHGRASAAVTASGEAYMGDGNERQAIAPGMSN